MGEEPDFLYLLRTRFWVLHVCGAEAVRCSFAWYNGILGSATANFRKNGFARSLAPLSGKEKKVLWLIMLAAFTDEVQ